MGVQDRDQLKKKFKVIRTGKNYAELSKFLMDQNLDFEREIIFYQFPKAGMDLLHYREVIRVSNSKVYMCELFIHGAGGYASS